MLSLKCAEREQVKVTAASLLHGKKSRFALIRHYPQLPGFPWSIGHLKAIQPRSRTLTALILHLLRNQLTLLMSSQGITCRRAVPAARAPPALRQGCSEGFMVLLDTAPFCQTARQQPGLPTCACLQEKVFTQMGLFNPSMTARTIMDPD